VFLQERERRTRQQRIVCCLAGHALAHDAPIRP
jgi:hypothetical protein